jgi:hypothetical protein
MKYNIFVDRVFNSYNDLELAFHLREIHMCFDVSKVWFAPSLVDSTFQDKCLPLKKGISSLLFQKAISKLYSIRRSDEILQLNLPIEKGIFKN